MRSNGGLREDIKAAKSSDEVKLLLAEGKQFTQASEKTKRAWSSTAKKRIAQLSVESPAARCVREIVGSANSWTKGGAK